MTERVGSGPNGKWPVLFCPVAHCGAVVEAAVSFLCFLLLGEKERANVRLL